MANYQNHLVDPTFFFDCNEEFAFNYDWFSEEDIQLDDLGRKVTKYERREIRGSLQSQGVRLNQRAEGNIEEMKYQFYCMAKFRIKIGDFIVYKGRYLHVDAVHDYDEWGVRNCDLTMVNLMNYKDLLETIKYLDGEMII